MSQKKTAESSRRDAILSAALPLFLANGYEKTSMRMIASKVGCEVGLVYYYFATKEEIFDSALNLYFDEQNTALAALAEKESRDITRFFDSLFAYLEKEAPSFSELFLETVHWTVLSAVRVRFASLTVPHIEAAIAPLAESGRLPHSAAFTAKTIAGLLVPAALDSDKAYFSANKASLRATVNHLLGTDKATSKRKDIPSFLL